MRVLLLATALLSTAAVLPELAIAQSAPARKPVRGVDDLPRYSYPLQGDVAQIVQDRAAIRQLAGQVRKDIATTLAGYDITDRATLRTTHQSLRDIALIEDDMAALRRETDAVRALQDKEADKLLSGLSHDAMIAARAAGAPDTPAFAAAFRAAYARKIDALPWAVVGTDISKRYNTLETLTANLIIGATKAGLQPSIDKGGALTLPEAGGLIRDASTLALTLPLKPEIAAVEGAYIKAKAVTKADIWTARDVSFANAEGLTPVVIGVWDSGTDTSLFAGQLWTNPNETANGRDDDGNGFVDDIHGIAFDANGKRSPLLLDPAPQEIAPRLNEIALLNKGWSEKEAGIDTPDARNTVAFMQSASAETMSATMQAMSFYSNHAHGTHVAGIVAKGDPAVRMLVARYSFDWRSPPRRPTRETATALAQVHRDTVAYFKQAGVRVVNTSWTVDLKTEYEDQLTANGVPADAAAVEARELFAIEAAGLKEAIAGAPDILFVAAAGNSNDSAAFSGAVPAALELPNMITVSAVDQAGEPTGFTSAGPTIDIAANGYQVESFMPGGLSVLASGTSMASPNVVNAAAKILAVNPKLTTAQLREILLGTATATPAGYKLLDTKAAVAKARAAGG